MAYLKRPEAVEHPLSAEPAFVRLSIEGQLVES